MKHTLIALLIAALLAACGDPGTTTWAGRDVDGSAKCPQGQTLYPYGPSGIPACK